LRAADTLRQRRADAATRPAQDTTSTPIAALNTKSSTQTQRTEHDLDAARSAEYEIIDANAGIAPAYGKRLISIHFFRSRS
jgi:hypothetical protein